MPAGMLVKAATVCMAHTKTTYQDAQGRIQGTVTTAAALLAPFDVAYMD